MAGCEQGEVFDVCAAPLVDKFLDGCNACLMTYGQTASGKTYTAGTDSTSIPASNEVFT